MSHITLYTKPPGQRSAGKPHAALDEAGAGNVAMVAGLRAVAKAAELPPEPKVRAPVLDPTLGEGMAARSFPYPTHAIKDTFCSHRRCNYIT